MNEFVRCNKLMGVHWMQGPVDKLKIKIRLKPPCDIISLPKFEDYTNETGNISLEQSIEEFSFNWQEKCFSEFEVQRYKDVHNCLTENELVYHNLTKSKETVSSKVFTYIHDDYYIPLPEEKRRNVGLLSSCLEYLSLDGVVGRIGDAFGKSASERQLFKSQEDICEDDEQWTAMHVVLDNSNYNEGVVMKQEATLLSIFHNTIQNFTILSPDVNNLETNPYTVETCGGNVGTVVELGYRYAVEVEFGAQRGGGDLDTLLLNVVRKWEKKHKQLVNFILPPLDKAHWYLNVEIATARGFSADNLYIQYHVKLAEGVHCRDALQGRSPVCEASSAPGVNVFHFGHLLDLCLETEPGAEAGPIQIYCEAISTDRWRRHRTEGYCRLPLRLAPGAGSQELRCVRPDEAAERRFFLGGCHLLALEALSAPALQNGDYTYTETGSITLRTGLLAQRSLPPAGPAAPPERGEGEGTAALLRGAEAALARYRRARARLAHAAAPPR